MNNYTPAYDRYLLSVEDTSKTESGLFVVKENDSEPVWAKVEKVGSGGRFIHEDKVCNIPPKYKVGDRVLIPNMGLTYVKLDGEKYVIIKEDQILMTCSEE